MESNQTCSLCNRRRAEIACRCSGNIVLLGNCCAVKHFKEKQQRHQLMDLEVALGILKGKPKGESTPRNHISYDKLYKSLESYRSKLQRFKENVILFGERYIESVRETILQSVSQLDSIMDTIATKLEKIDSFINFPNEEGYDLMQKFKSEGLKGVLENSPQHLVIREREAMQMLSGLIYIGHKSILKKNPSSKKVRITLMDELDKEINSSSVNISRVSLNSTPRSISFSTLDFECDSRDSISDISRSSSRSGFYEDDVGPFGYIYQPAETFNLDREEMLSDMIRENRDKEGIARQFFEREKSRCINAEQRALHYKKYANKRYIYSLDKGRLVEFDFYLNNSEEYDPLYFTPYEFSSNCTNNKYIFPNFCMLPNGDLFFAGGRCYSQKPGSNETCNFIASAFVFRVSMKEAIKLPSMHIGRSGVGIVFHKDFVYVFGGNTAGKRYSIRGKESMQRNSSSTKVATAERFDLFGNRWQKLPNMIKARMHPLCITAEDSIFILCGSAEYIEEFNTATQSYREVNISIGCEYYIGMSGEDKIYLLTSSKIFIFDKRLRKTYEEDCNNKNIFSASSNIISLRNNFIFKSCELIQKFNTSSKKTAIINA